MDNGDDADRWGLAAQGIQGDVELELLSSFDGARWSLQLAIGLIRLGVAVDPAVLHQLRQFLAETFRTGAFLDRENAPGRWQSMPEKSLILGTAGDVEVRIHKDGKYDDRYFVILCLRGGYLSFALTIDQTVALTAAVQQAIHELEPSSPPAGL
jgi:hypothetical protein